MEPKFQSSFIPKGPAPSPNTGIPLGPRRVEKSFFSFISLVIFSISVLLAIGVFGYKFYLNYRIDKMGTDLENARASLQPEVISELTRLDNRIISANELLSTHRALIPLFEFLEVSTPRTVRFTEFRYSVSNQGLELIMRGEARGYAALALQADILNKSQYFKNPIFSDLTLNDRGDVRFSFKAIVDPYLVSYRGRVTAQTPNVTSATGSSTVATSTQN
ncbi:MAG: hypothetical protein WAX80_02315 [Minisyncoccia bacterium]